MGKKLNVLKPYAEVHGGHDTAERFIQDGVSFDMDGHEMGGRKPKKVVKELPKEPEAKTEDAPEEPEAKRKPGRPAGKVKGDATVSQVDKALAE